MLIYEWNNVLFTVLINNNNGNAVDWAGRAKRQHMVTCAMVRPLEGTRK